jgi:hypothetical protein
MTPNASWEIPVLSHLASLLPYQISFGMWQPEQNYKYSSDHVTLLIRVYFSLKVSILPYIASHLIFLCFSFNLAQPHFLASMTFPIPWFVCFFF